METWQSPCHKRASVTVSPPWTPRCSWSRWSSVSVWVCSTPYHPPHCGNRCPESRVDASNCRSVCTAWGTRWVRWRSSGPLPHHCLASATVGQSSSCGRIHPRQRSIGWIAVTELCSYSIQHQTIYCTHLRWVGIKSNVENNKWHGHLHWLIVGHRCHISVIVCRQNVYLVVSRCLNCFQWLWIIVWCEEVAFE